MSVQAGAEAALERLRAELAAVAPGGPSVVTVGKFDGVHIAHAEIVRTVVARARARGAAAGVLTFDPLPYVVFNPGKPYHYLCTVEERLERLRALGADFVATITFSLALSRLSAREFLEALVQTLGMVEFVGGPDAAIGRDREGSGERLRALSRELGFTFVEVPPVLLDGVVVNSSLVRHFLWDGAVERAARALGRPYRLSGTVVPGDRRGRELGFPTANLLPPPHLILPGDGIYGCRATVDGMTYRAAVNIGVRPTFGESLQRLIEAFLLDFEGDLYGRLLTLEFIHRVRAETRFASVDALITQMHDDVRQVRERVDLGE
ncbi:MAG: riboflavin biosynthesis protein RibF [Chloroflexota bacterium]|nr:riboflavin biosynthesis protein RibF [Chloroflexota bacterium]